MMLLYQIPLQQLLLQQLPLQEIPAQKLIAALDQISLVALILICLVIGVGLTATVLATRACWPQIAEELDLMLVGTRSWKRFLLGLINGPVIFIICSIITKILPLIGLLSFCGLAVLIIMGLVAEMAYLGRRVLALRSASCTLFAQSLAGGVTIVAIFMLPVLGQAFFFGLLFRSLGTTIFWLFKRKKLPRATQPLQQREE